MFILRTIYPNGSESNEIINDLYTQIPPESKEQFQAALNIMWQDSKQREDNKNTVHAFLQCGRIIPLYFGWAYYIMTGEGKTFSNLSKNK